MKPKGTPDSQKVPIILSIGPYHGRGGSSTPGETPKPTEKNPQMRWRDLIEEGQIFEKGNALIRVGSAVVARRTVRARKGRVTVRFVAAKKGVYRLSASLVGRRSSSRARRGAYVSARKRPGRTQPRVSPAGA